MEEPSVAPGRRLWHVLRAVLFMLRKSMSKRPNKLAMDLQLLLLRGKIAGGKTLGKLMGSSTDLSSSSFPSSRTVVEVEFSCSNTPSLIQTVPAKRRDSNRRRTHRGANGGEPGWYNYDAADIAKVFEILNNDQLMLNDDDDGPAPEAPPLGLAATPLTTALWSSAPVRQLRVTDSPFPLGVDEDGGMVDQEADEFIRRFYNQLRTQQSPAAATPGTATGVAY